MINAWDLHHIWETDNKKFYNKQDIKNQKNLFKEFEKANSVFFKNENFKEILNGIPNLLILDRTFENSILNNYNNYIDDDYPKIIIEI